MVARLTDVVLLFVWASSPTAPPLQLVLVAFEVSHLRRIAILALPLSETGRNQYQIVLLSIARTGVVTVLFCQG